MIKKIHLNMSRPVFFLILAFSLVFNILIFFSYPVADADEVGYTEPAFNLVRRGNDASYSLTGVMHLEKEFIFCGKLYTYLNSAVFQLFGYGLLQVRLLPFAFGLLNIWLAYIFFRRLSGDKIALFVSALLLLSTDFLPKKSGRPDMLMVSVVFFTLISYLRFSGERKLILVGIISTLGIWIHPSTSYLPAIILYMFCIKDEIKKLPWIIAGQAIGGITYLLLIVVPMSDFYFQQFTGFTRDYVGSSGAVGVNVMNVIITLRDFFFAVGSGKNIPLFALVALSVVMLIVKKNRAPVILFAFVFIAYFIASIPTKHGGRMYLFVLLPFMFYAISSCVFNMKKFVKHAVVGIVVYMVATDCGLISKYYHNTSNASVAEAASVFNENDNVLSNMAFLLFNDKPRMYDVQLLIFAIHKAIAPVYGHLYGRSFDELIRNFRLNYLVIGNEHIESLNADWYPQDARREYFDIISKSVLIKTVKTDIDEYRIYKLPSKNQ